MASPCFFRRWIAVASLSVVGALLLSCGGGGPDLDLLAPDVVAVYEDGQVTVADVKRAAAAMSAAPKEEESGGGLEVRRRQIRRLVVDRLILDEARRVGADQDSSYTERLHDRRQHAVVDAYLKRYPISVRSFTDAQMKVFFDRNPELFHRPATRRVRHLFLRLESSSDLDELLHELDELRRRVMQGEDFGELAAAYSDSESRHDGGNLGWMTPTGLPKDLADVVFALEVRVPSESIVTVDGAHLFLVEEARDEVTLTFDQAKPTIRDALVAERRRREFERMVEQLPEPTGCFAVEEQDLRYLLEGGHPTSIVLRCGDTELRLGRFKVLVQREAARLGRRVAEADFLQYLKHRSILYHHCLSEGFVNEPEVAEVMAQVEREELLRFYRVRKLEQEIDRRSEQLMEYYEEHKDRYSSPLRIEVRRFVVPMDSEALDTMKDLEGIADDPDPDRLQRMATELGGQVEELGLVKLDELARVSPRAARFAAQLSPGSCSPPFRDGPLIEVVEVTDRIEPEPLPFATVLDQVRFAFMMDYRDDLEESMSERMLADVRLYVIEERLDFEIGESDTS